MKLAKNALFLIAILVMMQALSGCGGSGTSASASTDTPATVFSPNYVSSLDYLVHWQTLPVKVYFSLPSDFTALYPSDLPDNAALSWNQPQEQTFFQIVGSESQADVVCSVVDAQPSTWNQNTLGMTEFYMDFSIGLIVPGSVKVTCTIYDGSSRQQSLASMQTTIAHELGHALGIDGHSPYRGDLLYPNIQDGVIAPQVRDINTIKSAYPTYFTNRSMPLRAAPAPEQKINPACVIHRTIE